MKLLKTEKSYGIRPSEVAANKIQNHLEDLLETRPRVYRRTIKRYIDLAYILLECINKILKFLTSELLSSSTDTEFDELTNSEEDSDEIMKIQMKLQSTSELLDSYSQLAKRTKDTESSHATNALIVKQYGDIFTAANNTDLHYVEVNECANLIYFWYTTRVAYMTVRHKAYQNLQLPIWTAYIVIMYGKSLANGTHTEFVNWFKSWCTSANEDFSNKYVVPKELTLMKKQLYANDLTLEALIIYDILIDKGYFDLTTMDNDAKLDANYIVTLMKNINPDSKHIIQTRFSKQDEYIEQIGLTPTNVDEGVAK